MTENEDGARPVRPMDEEDDSDDDYLPPPEDEPEHLPRRSTRKKEKPTSSSKSVAVKVVIALDLLHFPPPFQRGHSQLDGRLFVR